MPLVLADLEVPAADAQSRVPASRPVEVRLGLRHQAGSEATAEFRTVRLELSYDGQEWSELSLTPTGDRSYKASVSAKQPPSLRVTIVDAGGNKLVQEITRAYGVR
jgi:hypothetical protein